MKLKVIRAMKDVSQYDLNLRTGIPQSKISLFERGYLKPNKNEKTAIAKALNVNVDELEWRVLENG